MSVLAVLRHTDNILIEDQHWLSHIYGCQHALLVSLTGGASAITVALDGVEFYLLEYGLRVHVGTCLNGIFQKKKNCWPQGTIGEVLPIGELFAAILAAWACNQDVNLRGFVLRRALKAIAATTRFHLEHGHVSKEVFKLIPESFSNECSLELLNLHSKDVLHLDRYLGSGIILSLTARTF